MIIWPSINDREVYAIETRYEKATDTRGSRYAARRVWPFEEWHTVATDYALGAGVRQFRRAAEELAGGPVALVGETDTGLLFVTVTTQEEGEKNG